MSTGVILTGVAFAGSPEAEERDGSGSLVLGLVGKLSISVGVVCEDDNNSFILQISLQALVTLLSRTLNFSSS